MGSKKSGDINVVKFSTGDPPHSKRIWKCAVEQHTFFRYSSHSLFLLPPSFSSFLLLLSSLLPFLLFPSPFSSLSLLLSLLPLFLLPPSLPLSSFPFLPSFIPLLFMYPKLLFLNKNNLQLILLLEWLIVLCILLGFKLLTGHPVYSRFSREAPSFVTVAEHSVRFRATRWLGKSQGLWGHRVSASNLTQRNLVSRKKLNLWSYENAKKRRGKRL